MCRHRPARNGSPGRQVDQGARGAAAPPRPSRKIRRAARPHPAAAIRAHQEEGRPERPLGASARRRQAGRRHGKRRALEPGEQCAGRPGSPSLASAGSRHLRAIQVPRRRGLPSNRVAARLRPPHSCAGTARQAPELPLWQAVPLDGVVAPLVLCERRRGGGGWVRLRSGRATLPFRAAVLLRQARNLAAQALVVLHHIGPAGLLRFRHLGQHAARALAGHARGDRRGRGRREGGPRRGP